MRKRLKNITVSALAVSLLPLAGMQVNAAPVSPAQPAGVIEDSGGVVQVRDGRWRDGRSHRRGWGWGPAVGGLATGLAIGALTAPRYGYAAPVYEGDGDGYAQCAATFRSFNPSTGTYVTYGGEVRVCPYL